MNTRNFVHHQYFAMLPVALAACLSPCSVHADIITYNLSNHPDSGNAGGGIYPPHFGLRLDGLLTGSPLESYVFDFDNAQSNMNMTWNTATNELHIYGVAYGGQDAGGVCSGACVDANGDDLNDSTADLWNIDFTYDMNVGIPGGEGGFDDIMVAAPGHANSGTLSSSLFSFELRDHYSDFFGSSFEFGDETGGGHRGYPGLSGWGWVDYCNTATGACLNATWSGSDQGETFTSDWIFVASPVPLPGAAVLLGSGLLGLIGIARRRKN